MSIAILGAGKMGVAVAFGLAKLGNHITLVDNSQEALEKAESILNPLTEKGEIPQVLYALGDIENVKNPSTVMSCLPYHQNFELAKYCIDNHIAYCDLGGSVEVENQIKEYAKNTKKPVMLSLGLAPGLINIITEDLIQKYGIPDVVNMYVGGLPTSSSVDYCCNWSVDGLLNEYKAPVEVLEAGEIVIYEGLDGYQLLDGDYEAFLTSGGISHSLRDLKERGVRYSYYKTLRYKGHITKIQTLLKSGLSDEQIKKCITTLYPFNALDRVDLKIHLSIEEKSGWSKVNFDKHIYSDKNFTAMARSTGFSAASVVDLVENCQIRYGLCSYKDIPLEKFFENLNKLGL